MEEGNANTMIKEKRLRRVSAAALLILLALLMLPAANIRAESGQCTLRIEYKDGAESVQGAVFHAYRAAEVNENWEYELTEPFQGFGESINTRMDHTDWVTTAEALADYAEANEIRPDASGETDGNGSLIFEGLETGFYLVTGEPLTAGQTTYTPQTYCIVLPDRLEDGTLVYDVTTEPKFDWVNEPDAPAEGDLSVTKTVTGAGDVNRDWHFTVTTEPALNGTYGGMTFENGVCAFTLKHGQTKYAAGLPAGTRYTVTEEEANRDGYTTSGSGLSGTVSEGTAAEAKFTNDLPAVPTEQPNRPNRPDTGDRTPVGLWIALIVAALAGVGVALFAGKRKK